MWGRALDTYRHVLGQAEANVFAANGVGAVLAERGDLDAARRVLVQARRPKALEIPNPKSLRAAHVPARARPGRGERVRGQRRRRGARRARRPGRRAPGARAGARPQSPRNP